MVHEKQTIKNDADKLQSLLLDEERSQSEIDAYFRDVYEVMKEEAAVIDPQKARAALVLLARNLVLASSDNNGGRRAIDKMTDVYKEVLHFGAMFAGVNLDAAGQDAAQPSIHEKFENLQVALEADDRIALPEHVSPEATIGLTEALVLANTNILSTPDYEGVTNHTDIRYYVGNFVAARRIMTKGDA